jgi:branched-chain amino acid transport system ATP-binding protein
MTLAVEGLEVRYGAVRAVEAMSLHVGDGEVVALLGANGAGKSSALKALLALVPHQVAALRLDAHDLKAAGTQERLAAGLALSPEGRHVFPALTVRENLDLGYLGKPSPVAAARREAMYALFPRLRERESQAAGSLSGGEQQMLAIARAVMAGPRVLMLDEPTMGLAPIVVRELVAAIRHLSTQGVGVLLAEQNAGMALGVADRGYVLQNGRIVAEDSAAALRASERVRKAFLGLAGDPG